MRALFCADWLLKSGDDEEVRKIIEERLGPDMVNKQKNYKKGGKTGVELLEAVLGILADIAKIGWIIAEFNMMLSSFVIGSDLYDEVNKREREEKERWDDLQERLKEIERRL